MLITTNYSFIPNAIGPQGVMRSIDSSGTAVIYASEHAVSIHTQWNILGKADARWKSEKGSALFHGSYLFSSYRAPWQNSS